jgi:starvation-inducible DNA-binding protein
MESMSSPWRTRIDLAESVRKAVAAQLNILLAASVDLRQQAKQAHWNVKGPQFASLHALFDEVAGEVDEWTDELAERAVTLGGIARGTVQEAARVTDLPELSLEQQWGCDHVQSLSATLAAFARSIRAAIPFAESAGDAGTADLFTATSRAVDKLLWKVEAHGWRAG